ncbi:hypothetical protein [Mycobacterium sp.]|jgi:hypothetical protein|uniref:hypothetical protein n=1 Tax=Mycobacterium sp. TaxID=1785 RepID=UPI0025CD3488|nr:hypothetical protein [Mycobacterium sp.]
MATNADTGQASPADHTPAGNPDHAGRSAAVTGLPAPTWAESTACAALVIIPGQLHTSAVIGGGVSQFDLRHCPSGRRVAAADERAALHHLAEQLAWFEPVATDPRYLDDPAHADVCESLRELLHQWCATESDYHPHAALLASAGSPRCLPPVR